MPREDTIFIIDNSEWMRNGDYPRNRFDAQAQGVDKMIRLKKQSHPENTFGLISSAGKNVEVLVALTTSDWKVNRAARTMNGMGGNTDLLKALKVAQLALNFRTMKSIQARIVIFLGSPVNEIDEKELIKVARNLTKNKVAVDVISIGETQVNSEILNKFIKVMKDKSAGDCHLLEVAPGSYLEDAIDQSPLKGDIPLSEEDEILAQVLEQSRLEARAREAELNGEAPVQIQNRDDMMEDDEDEDALLQEALAMSMAETNAQPQKEEKKVGSALNENFVANVLKKAGVDVDKEELDQEIDDLKKTEKDKKDDKKQ